MEWTLSKKADFVSSSLRGGTVNEAVRKSSLLYDLGPLKKVFKERVRNDLPEWIKTMRATSFPFQGSELEIVAHNDGAHFRFHTDTGINYLHDGRSRRVLSGVYYFNREPKAFTGGQLRLFPIGTRSEDVYGDKEPECVVIEPEQNSFAIFPSWAPHDVARVTCESKAFADSRFAVNCWMHETVEPTA